MIKSLVVDDEYIDLHKLVTMLSQLGRCDAATNGEQAYAFFRKAIDERKPYRLITVDISLPGMSGLDLILNIISEERKWKMPPSKKILISAQPDEQTVKWAAQSKCDAFVLKPIRKEVILKKIEDMGIK